MALLDEVRAALADEASYSTPQLNQLNQACGRDSCHRRERILHQLRHYAAQQVLPMAATSTTHQFKRDFAHQSANIEVNGVTKAVTAQNLTDEDVPLLRQYGYGHFLQELPKPEGAGGEPHTEESLGKLKKDELVALHQEVVGEAAKSDLKKDELVAAILAAQTPQE